MERLIDFLYILARDYVTLGDLETIMWDHVDTEPSVYSNTYLEAYVRDLAMRLTDDEMHIVCSQSMEKDRHGDKRIYKPRETPANG